MNIADEAKAIEARVWFEYHLEPRYDGANGAIVMVFNSPGEGQKTVKLWLYGDAKPMAKGILVQRIEHAADDPRGEKPHAVHGQWARYESEAWPAIRTAMLWLSGIYQGYEPESIGGEARADV